MKYVFKSVLTVVMLSIWGAFKSILSVAASLMVSEAAVTQLQNSNTAYLQFMAMQSFMGAVPGWVVPLGIIALLWGGDLIQLFKWGKVNLFLCLFSLAMVGYPLSAHAYYNERDYPEWVQILPNQTVFMVPCKGANQSSQAKFMSQEYLESVKVPAKRIQITHEELQMPALTRNQFVPNVQAYIVDRTPYMRSWVSSADRGTSKKDDGFYFESSDSINMKTGISISASIEEANAAKFLYYFGTNPIGDMTKPENIYASVIYGKPLPEVVDTNVHGYVQALLAKEFGGRTFDKAIADKGIIIANVEAAVKQKFEPMGITIHYIGYAEGLTFDNAVQDSLNKTLIAQKKAQEYAALNPVLPVMQAENDMQVKSALANRWNGQVNMPSFMILSESIVNWVQGLFTSTPKK